MWRRVWPPGWRAGARTGRFGGSTHYWGPRPGYLLPVALLPANITEIEREIYIWISVLQLLGASYKDEIQTIFHIQMFHRTQFPKYR